MANLYNKYILPKVTNFACGGSPTKKQRQKIVPLAKGRILEIGIGSGLNLPFYEANKINQLIGLDPSEEMLKIARQKKPDISFPLNFIQASSEEIPLKNNSVDTVLITYTLCTIPNPADAFAEIKRVLSKDGLLIFCEHGLAPDKSIRRIQDGINPIWKKLGGGCHLNRKIDDIILHNGFSFESLETMYIPGWKFASFNYWGTAKVK